MKMLTRQLQAAIRFVDAIDPLLFDEAKKQLVFLKTQFSSYAPIPKTTKLMYLVSSIFSPSSPNQIMQLMDAVNAILNFRKNLYRAELDQIAARTLAEKRKKFIDIPEADPNEVELLECDWVELKASGRYEVSADRAAEIYAEIVPAIVVSRQSLVKLKMLGEIIHDFHQFLMTVQFNEAQIFKNNLDEQFGYVVADFCAHVSRQEDQDKSDEKEEISLLSHSSASSFHDDSGFVLVSSFDSEINIAESHICRSKFDFNIEKLKQKAEELMIRANSRERQSGRDHVVNQLRCDAGCARGLALALEIDGNCFFTKVAAETKQQERIKLAETFAAVCTNRLTKAEDSSFAKNHYKKYKVIAGNILLWVGTALIALAASVYKYKTTGQFWFFSQKDSAKKLVNTKDGVAAIARTYGVGSGV